MFKLLFVSSLVLTVFNASAEVVEVTSCEDNSVSLNSVYSMKTYANTTVKVFEVDTIEPAAASVGVAIAIDRGNEGSELESFCRYVRGLSWVEIQQAKSKYDQAAGILTLTMAARSFDPSTDQFTSKDLVLEINKAAKSEEGLVTATLK